MKKRKIKIVKGVVNAVLACMLGTAFFSINVQAASLELTYDSNASKTGYHLEVYEQKECVHNPNRDGRAIYTTMTGLTPTPEQVMNGVVNSGGLTYALTSYTAQPVGEGAERIGNTVVAYHVYNVGNAINGVIDAVLAGPYTAVNGYAGYAYYRGEFSHCPYTGKESLLQSY